MQMQSSSSKEQTDLNDSLVLSQLEDAANLDVIWDWQSPNTARHNTRVKQRVNVQQSPKLTLKRPPSNSQLDSFSKLQEKMRILKDQVECCTNNVEPSISDVFSDSMEDELVLCSQKVEQEWLKGRTCTKEENLVKCDASNNKAMVDNVTNTLLQDESFAIALKEFETDFSFSNEETFSSDRNETKHSETHQSLPKRTDSVAAVPKTTISIPSNKETHTSTKSDIVIKCSPEEIEKKRLQALAKLRAKQKRSKF